MRLHPYRLLLAQTLVVASVRKHRAEKYKGGRMILLGTLLFGLLCFLCGLWTGTNNPQAYDA